MTPCNIDFETYSDANLKTVGVHRYAVDPSTEVLMLAYGRPGSVPKVWEPHLGPIPDDLKLIIEDDEVTLHAFNAAFEWEIFNFVLGIMLPIARFRCTMVLSYSLGFSGGLADVQNQIGMRPDKLKLKEGRALILRFCKPQPKNHKVPRWTWQNDPAGWAKFVEYCRQDVVAETELNLWLSRYTPMSEMEWEIWELDQKINHRGVPIDVDYAEGALDLHKQVKHRIKEGLKAETGLSNPLSSAQMKGWLAEHGVFMPNMQAATITQVNAREYQPILDDYSKAVATAPTKYKAFINCEVNGNVHGMFQFRGASRTGRWAGRRVQLQNLKRGNIDAVTAAAIKDRHLECVTLAGDPMDLLAKGVRSTISAPKGTMLNVSDLSSIESRILGWLTGCARINEIFRTGHDTYKDLATLLFNVPYDQVTKEQRTFAKPPVLGAGYGLGAKGMKAYAKAMGVEMTSDEAEHAVYTFRDTYHEIPRFWTFIIDAIAALLTRGLETRTPLLRVHLSSDQQFLWITLPSGRRLAYYQPLWIMWDTPIGEKMSFTYMGQDRFTLQWCRIAAHHGLITENIVQAIARDVLAVWLLRADRADFRTVLHVHDELGCVEATDRVDELNDLIRQPIPWAPGLLLDAAGYVALRYKK